jgi:predicted kinase
VRRVSQWSRSIQHEYVTIRCLSCRRVGAASAHGGHNLIVTAAGYVILSGPPASGKSTLGPRLAEALHWPYLAKDTIKRALIAELGAADVAASRQLGAAAMTALLAVAVEAGCGVLDGSWLRGRSPQMVQPLPRPVAEVFCRCPQQLLEQRYRARAATRGDGHFDLQRTWAELWGDELAEPVAGGWPVIEVDAARDIDVSRLADEVRASITSGV